MQQNILQPPVPSYTFTTKFLLLQIASLEKNLRELTSESIDDIMTLMVPYAEFQYFLVPLPYLVSLLGMLVKVPVIK